MIKTIQHLEGQELDRGDVRNMVDQLEDLRTSNSQLRGIAEEAIEEVEQVEQKLSEMEDELAVAESKIKDLEEQVNDLDRQRMAAVALNKELEKLVELKMTLAGL